MALALPSGATLVSLDVNEETTALARGYAEEAGVADRIDYRTGQALELLPDVEEGPFDVVFIDAWKDDYLAYFEAVLPRLADNGIILCDNTLSGMRADHPLAEFNRRVRDDPRVECLLLPRARRRHADPATTSGVSSASEASTTSASASASSPGG